MAPPDPQVGRVPIRDARSVRRPDGIGTGAVAVRQELELSALGRHEVEVGDELRVPVVAARRREDQLRAVGRPDRGAVVLLGVGELSRLGASVSRDDEDLRATVCDPAFVVELVEEVRDAARRPPALVLFLRRLVADARGERDRAAVRRPGDPAHVLLQLRELLRLAAAERDDVELARLLLGPARDERQAAPVGRPARFPVAALPGREPARRLRAVDRREPDVAAVLVRLAVDRPLDVRDGRAVGAQARVGDPLERVDILGLHPAHPRDHRRRRKPTVTSAATVEPARPSARSPKVSV